MKVLSFSLFGDKPLYNVGIIKNIELAKKIYPDWICYVYYSDDVPVKTINTLKLHDNCRLFLEKRLNEYDGLFWRFKPFWDPEIYVCCPRNCGSRLSFREKHAVDEWLLMGHPFHIMRDAANHCYEIMPGMFGVNKKGSENFVEIFPTYPTNSDINLNDRACDQTWLTKFVWPLYIDKHVYHDYWYKNTNICDKIEDEPALYDKGIYNWLINREQTFPHLFDNKSIYRPFAVKMDPPGLFVGQIWDYKQAGDLSGNMVERPLMSRDAYWEYRIRGENIDYNLYKENVFSQNGEDGVIKLLFENLKISEGYVCEFGAWDGKHLSNTFNLVKQQNWTALLIESEKQRYNDLVNTAKEYKNIIPKCALVTSQNLGEMLQEHNFPKDFDLLSIDVDGLDYDIWKGLSDKWKPKIVIIESNSTVYPENSDFGGTKPKDIYKLGKSKGYELVILISGNLIMVDEKYVKECCINNRKTRYKDLTDGFLLEQNPHNGSVYYKGIFKQPC